MVTAFVELVLSFCFCWLAFVALYSSYLWWNTSRRVIRRKVLEAGY